MTLEAASALAHTPLFSRLQRQDLARLAAELDETILAPGELLVRQGERGDALYIIRTGVAEVTQSLSGGQGVTLLGPGDVIGEMALITREPRSATVVARTRLVTWRLPEERFLSLIGRDRGIAESIEATLSVRLADTSRTLSALHLYGEAMVESVLSAIDPPVSRILAAIATLPRWESELLEELCTRSGVGNALNLLETEAHLLYKVGDTYVVPPLVASATRKVEFTEVEAAWASEAAQALEDRGAWADAMDLYVRTPAPAQAAALLQHHRAELGQVASERRLGWLALLSTSHPDLFAGILPSHSTNGLAMKTPVPGLRQWSWLQLPWKTVAAWALAIGAFTSGWILPVPEGLGREAVVTLWAVAATVPLMSLGVLPEVAVGMLFAASLVTSGVVAPSQVLAGFASSSWLFLVVLFAIGASVTRTGLMYRLALLSLSRLPPTFIIQSLMLALTGIGLAACVPSARARVALAAPAARGLAEGLRYQDRSGGAAATGLVTFISAGPVTLFLTGTSMAVVLNGMLPAAVRNEFSWGHWVIGALVPSVLLLVFSYLAILALLRPPMRPALDPARLRLQQQLLGPMNRRELLTTFGVALLVLGLSTQAIHGVDATWVAVIVLCFLLVVGVLDWDAGQTGIVWGQLLFFGVILSLEGIFVALGIDRWLVAMLSVPLGNAVADPYAFVLLIGLAAFLLRLVVPYQATVTILALITIPLTLAAGYHPFVPVIVILIAGDHGFFPYLSTTYLTLHQSSGGQLFTHEQALPILRIESLLRIVVILASVPYWQGLGLL